MRNCRWMRVLVCFAFLVAACRTAWETRAGELAATSAIGWREQAAEWDNSSVPLLHLDGAWRPPGWPVGGKVALDITGFAGDQTGEQTAGVAVGLARQVQLVPEALWLSLGAGRAFLDTERDEIFSSSRDTWQVSFVEVGLQFPIRRGKGAWRIGIEVRYAWSDGPELEGQQLGGDMLDVFLLACFGP